MMFHEPWATAGSSDDPATGRTASWPERAGPARGDPLASSRPADGLPDAHPALDDAIASEVVPRIVLAHRPPASPPVAAAQGAPAGADIATLAEAARRNDLDAALALIERLCARGAGLETLYLDLVSPAAALLGQMWHDDTASIVEVTIGLACLQRLVHALAPAFHQDDLRPDPQRRVLLAPLPGEQHSFALVLVAEFLRRAGWSVDNGRVLSCAALCDLVRQQWFAVAGLSVSCTTRLDVIAAAVHALRHASCNSAIGVMVGGPLFRDHPEFVAQVGADAMALDARHAVVQAESLAALMAGRR